MAIYGACFLLGLGRRILKASPHLLVDGNRESTICIWSHDEHKYEHTGPEYIFWGTSPTVSEITKIKNSQSFGRWNIALRETNIWSSLTPPFAISGPTLCDQCNFCWHAQHSGRDSHWKSEGIGDLLKVKPRVLFYLRDHLLGKGTICWEKRDHLLGKKRPLFEKRDHFLKKETSFWKRDHLN